MENLQPYMVYWPAGAAGAAFLLVVLTLILSLTRGPKIRAAREVIVKSRQQLKEARVAAKVSKAKVKVRQAHIAAMHKSAGKLFWRAEKTWVE